MICWGNFACSRCCVLLPADGSTGMRSAPARSWNSGRGQHGLISFDSGWWEWLVRAEHSSGPWRIDISWRHGEPRASFGFVMFRFRLRCYSLLDCHRQSYSFYCHRPNYSLYGTGCPSWCLGNVLAFLDIAAVQSFLRLLLAFLMSAWIFLVDVSSAGCRYWMSLWLESGFI